uniref:Putative ribonuclease H-like domain-containing protein n=1 Tax=Tanacetum cinerariifolium TaxID=118510 RepID=A0A6L2JYR6_TANCI|nr:putative ribonuclease H-like domain-containing protein [Tanacetum cinerariifolium]
MVEKSVVNNKGKGTSQKEVRPVWNNAIRVNHQNFSKMTHPHPKRNFVPIAFATKSEQVLVNAAKQNSAASTSTVRPKGKIITTARPKAVVNAAEGKKDTAVKTSVEYQDIDGGFVAFGGSPKGGKITYKGKIRTGILDFKDVYFVKKLKFNLFSVSQMCDKKNSVLFTKTECLVLSPDFKLLDESQVLLKVPKQNNMYSFDLENVISLRDLNCLFAKATTDESNLWHKRLGQIIFKTLNKLVRGNLVRGFLLKNFENDHSCVACKKGKQHKASWNQSNGDAGDVNASDQQGDVNASDIQGDVDEISRNDNVCQRNEIRIDSSTHVVNAASISINTVSNIITAGSLNINTADSNHTNMSTLEATGIFNGAFDDRDLGAEADINNLDSSIVGYWLKMGFKNKLDERGIVIRNKARLVAQGHIWEEGTDYDEVFAQVARIEAIRLFLAYASFKDFIVYQMDVTSVFICNNRGRGTMVVNSTTEAEYVAALSYCGQPQKPRRKQRKEAETSHDESEDEDHVLTPSSDPLPSGEDSSILNELMVFYTSLQEHSRSKGLKRLKRFGSCRRVKSPMEKDGLGAQEDASKQRRMIVEIDQNAKIVLDDETQGRTNNDEMFGVDDLTGEEVVVETTTGIKDSSTPTTNLIKDEITMAQALAALKSVKPKVVVQKQEMSTTIPATATIVTTVVPTPRAKGFVFHEQKQSQIPTVSSSKDKGKAKMIEPEVPLKKKEQMRIDKEYARKLQAEEQEATRLNRAQQDEEANNSWDNI